MTAENILNEAAALVSGDRSADHGNMYSAFEDAALMWSIILGHEVEPHAVALCMMALKMTRIKHGSGSRDNFVDAAGYAGIAGALAEAKP